MQRGLLHGTKTGTQPGSLDAQDAQNSWVFGPIYGMNVDKYGFNPQTWWFFHDGRMDNLDKLLRFA